MITPLPFLLPGSSGGAGSGSSVAPGLGPMDPGESRARPVDVTSPEALRMGRPLSPEQDFLARFLLAMESAAAEGEVEGSREGFGRGFADSDGADGDAAEGGGDGLRALAALAFRTLGRLPDAAPAEKAAADEAGAPAFGARTPGPALAAALADPARPSRSLEGVHPELIQRMERVVDRMWNEHGHRVELVEGYRTQARQDHLYTQGRSRPGQVVTWTRNSAHTRGHAVDVKVNGGWSDLEAFKRLQVIANEEGLRTLGMRDAGHMELPRAVAAANPFTPDIPPVAHTVATAAEGAEGRADERQPRAPQTPLPHPAAVGSSLNGGGMGGGDLNRPWERANGERGFERATERMAERAAERVAERAAPPSRPAQGAGWSSNGVARVARVAQVAQVARVGGGVPNQGSRMAGAASAAAGNGAAGVDGSTPTGALGAGASGATAGTGGTPASASPSPIPPAPPPVEVQPPTLPTAAQTAAAQGGAAQSEGEVRAGLNGSAAFSQGGSDSEPDTRGRGNPASTRIEREGTRSRDAQAQAQARAEGEPSTLRPGASAGETERIQGERTRAGSAERFELPHLATAQTADSQISRVGGAGGAAGPDGPSTAQRVEQIRALQDSSRPPGLLRMDLTNVDGNGTDLRLAMQGRGVSAQIDVADAVRARFLQSRIGELRSALERRGLEPEALMARMTTAGTDQGPVREATRSESGHLHNGDEKDRQAEDESAADPNQDYSENSARRNDDQ